MSNNIIKDRYRQPLEINRIEGVNYDVLYSKLEKKAQFDKVENMAYAKMKAREKYYEQIDLNYVMEKLNGKRKDKDKWEISGSNVIFTKDQRWKFVNGSESDIKGRFGLRIVEIELGLNSFQVIDWFTDNFGFKYEDSLKIADEYLASDYSSSKSKNKNVFTPPFRNDDNWGNVFKYLNEERNIPSTLLTSLYKQGKIYADYNSRCVFLSTASAEIRGTPASSDPGFKGCTMGGQADVSGFSVMPQLNVNESVVAIIEAAVDAVSYNAIYPGRYAFSSNGSGRFELHYKVALEAMSNGFSLHMATDADMAGDIAAQKVFSAFLARDHIYKTYKKDHPELTYENIDKAIINGDILIKVKESPHHLFFNELTKNNQLKDEYPIFEKTMDLNGLQSWVDTGNKGEKEISYMIMPNAFSFIQENKEVEVAVSNNDITGLLTKYNLLRDRPFYYKDWNDELKKLGTTYISDFNNCFEDGFTKLPKLPNYFLENRKEVNPITFDHNGAARIGKVSEDNVMMEKNKDEVKNPNNEERKNSSGIFLTKMDEQDIFNIMYLRYYYHQKENLSFAKIDEKLKNKEIRVYKDKSQPFLNFVSEGYKKEYIYHPKTKEAGEDVFYPPTIRVYGNFLNEPVNIKVQENAFKEIIRRMQYLSNILKNEDNQLEQLEKLGFNCFEFDKNGDRIENIISKQQEKDKSLEKKEVKSFKI